MRSRKGALAVVLSTLLVLSVAGAALAQSPTTGSAEKLVLNVGVPGDMVSPNPFKACCGYEYEMMFLAYDMLFNFSAEDLTPIPGLAESCDPSSDYLTWTCQIRSGVKWSDGQPLTAADVAFTYQFIVDNKLGAFNDYLPFDPKFSAPNDTTLVWESSEPTFAPNTPPWVPIVPEHVWSKLDGKPASEIKTFNNVPAVGSGPFSLVEWKPNQFWRMEANKEYWGGSPTIDEVVFRVFNNQEAMVNALKAREVDFITDLKPTLFNALKGEQNIETYAATPSYFTNLAWNFGSPDMPNDTHNAAVEDLVVRQAVEYAIDKQALATKVWLGNAEVGTTITLPSSPWHFEPPADELYSFDLDKAKELLDGAGYKDTDGDGVREDPNNGEPLSFDILTLASSPGSEDSGKLMAGWMEQIGIDFNLRPVSEPKAYDLWFEGDFDAYVWSWGGDPDPDFILSIFTTGQCLSWSDGCYSNARYDKWYEEQRTIFDRAERKAFIDNMQDWVYKDIPEVVLLYVNTLQAYRTDRFTGYVPSPADGGSLLFGWGPYSYINLKPVSARTAQAGGGAGGISTGVWAAIAAGIVLVVVLVAVMRRRTSREERV